MSKIITFTFATPDPLKYEVKVAGKTSVKRREWDGEKLFAYFSEHFPISFAGRFPDVELRLEHSRKSAITLEGYKLSKDEGDAIKEAVAEMAGEVLADIDPEEFLNPAN